VPTTDVQPKIVKCIDIIYIKLCPTSGFREFHLKTPIDTVYTSSLANALEKRFCPYTSDISERYHYYSQQHILVLLLNYEK
jgi:hypothetical protein